MLNMLIRVLVVMIAATIGDPIRAQLTAEKVLAGKQSQRELTQTAVRTIVPEPGVSVEVTGSIVSGVSGNKGISTDSGHLLPVGNFEQIDRLPQGIPFQMKLTRDADGLDMVDVSDIKLAALAKWDSTKRSLPLNKFADVHRGFSNLGLTVERLKQQGAMSADDPVFIQDVVKTQESIVTAYQKAEGTGTREQLKALSEGYGALRSLHRRGKAAYGRSDNYWPEVYQRIYDNSRTAAAVARKGQPKPFGSSVLIGKSLVLTCRHVLNEFPVDQLEVWFDYEDRFEGPRQRHAFPVTEAVFIGRSRVAGTDPLDFALLKLGADGAGNTVEQLYKPTKLSSADVARDDALYVIGHPNRMPRMVHDNAFVLFPFRVTKDGMTHLKLIVDDEVRDTPNAQDEIKKFLDSYIPSADGTVYEQYSKRWYLSPVIAANCDTSEGNSGSGVWDRTTNRLVGILFDGEPNPGPDEPYESGWRRHEAILPITVIVQQVKSDPATADWVSKHGVTIE